MTDTMARLSAITVVVVAVVALAVLYVTSRPDIGGANEVKAEFKDAYPLLEGMNVRVYGAVAGSVSQIELGDDGNAEITMALHEGTEPPRTDATATIRQEDITGDSYVSLSPGDDPEPLGDTVIPTKRTLVAPRFDDLLNSFDEPVRQGLELLLVELGMTLDARGEDLNQAALALRPALAAADRALTEVKSQNRTLKALITDAERVNGQAASRSRELGELVEALGRTLSTTAAHAPALDQGLERAPETLTRAGPTLKKVTRTAKAATPVAETLAGAAPDLAESATLLGPFLDDAEAILGDVEPTLELVAALLDASEPTLEANPKRVFTAPFDIAAGIGGLLDTLIGDPTLIKSLFSAETYGGTEPGEAADDIGLGSVPVERGTQSGYPSSYDPQRRLVRAVTIPSCESFGVPIAPGCLANVLDGLLPGRAGGRGATADAGAGGGGRPGNQAADPGHPPGGAGGDTKPQNGLDDTLDQLGDGLNQGLQDLGDGLGGALEGLGLGRAKPSGKPDPAPARPGDVRDLLDFLLSP